MTIIALFGPPAAGKSHLILLAQKLGIPAFDVENLGTTYSERKDEFKKILAKNDTSYTMVGAADLKRSDFPKNTIKVLLLPPKKEYELRLNKRDELHPHKKGQNALHHYEQFLISRDKYDLVYEKVLSDKTLLNKILVQTKFPRRNANK